MGELDDFDAAIPGCNRESTFRALAAMTGRGPDQPGLPAPDAVAFRLPAALYLDFTTLDNAQLWASKLDATPRRIRQVAPADSGDGNAYSQWFGNWRGWLVYINATEPEAAVAAALGRAGES